MKVNKLKILSIAICCLVSVLWSQAQGMEGNIERSSLNFDFTCNMFSNPNNESNIPDGWFLADCSAEDRPGGKRSEYFPLTIEKKSIGEIEIKGAYHNFYRSVPELGRFIGKKFLLSADIKSLVSGARIAYVYGAWNYKEDDGIFNGKKQAQSSHHTGSGNWEPLSVEFTAHEDIGSDFGQRFYLSIVGGITNDPQQVFGIKNVKLWQLIY